MINQCLFCLENLPATVNLSDVTDAYEYKCARCGLVKATGTCEVFLSTPEHRFLKGKRHLMSGILRWRAIRGDSDYRTIRFEDVSTLLENGQVPRTVLDKVDKLIEYFGLMSKSFGHVLILDNQRDYPITHSSNNEVFKNIVDYLKSQKWLERRTSLEPGNPVGLGLSMEGWRRFHDLERTIVDTKQCFVAMNFAEQYDPIYKNIAEAINVCGFKPYRVKDVQHNNIVTDLIISEIRKSRFLVADFSGERPSVYFEAGYAKGLGKEVIWTCKKGESPHFDTRQYSHIFWQDGEDLKKQLTNRIEATIK